MAEDKKYKEFYFGNLPDTVKLTPGAVGYIAFSFPEGSEQRATLMWAYATLDHFLRVAPPKEEKDFTDFGDIYNENKSKGL